MSKSFSTEDIQQADAPQPGPCDATEAIREQTENEITAELDKACESIRQSTNHYIDTDDIVTEANDGEFTTRIQLKIDLQKVDQSHAVGELAELFQDLADHLSTGRRAPN